MTWFLILKIMFRLKGKEVHALNIKNEQHEMIYSKDNRDYINEDLLQKAINAHYKDFN